MLKGDVIYFPHKGPEVTGATLHERAQWLRDDGEIVLILDGPDGQPDNLHHWLAQHCIICARPHVVCNHLRVRHALDAVMGIAGPAPEIDFDALVKSLDGLADAIIARRRVLSPVAKEAAREQRQESDDIADVRDALINHVGVFSASPDADDAAAADLRRTWTSLNLHPYSCGMTVWYRASQSDGGERAVGARRI